MRLLGQPQTSLLFFMKRFRAYKNANQTNHSLRSFYMQKIVSFVVFCLFSFILLLGFDLICVFVCAKSFRKKKKNWFGVVLITSFYYTTVLLSVYCNSCFLCLSQLQMFFSSWTQYFAKF